MNNDLSHQYDLVATDFEEVIQTYAEESRNTYRGYVPNIKGHVTLDLGCGNGLDCKYFLEKGAIKVHGLDASVELLQKSDIDNPNIHLQYGIFERLPYEDCLFDSVFSKYALQTCPDLETVFREVWRVLKSGGQFMFLAVHPIRQLYEKKYEGKNYFEQQIVDSLCFDNKITFKEPTHTLKEYFSNFMIDHFNLELYEEYWDPDAEKIIDVYPGYLILRWVKK